MIAQEQMKMNVENSVFRPVEAECFSRPKSERQVKHAASAACVARRMM
jgi:hypothetical protein